MIFVICIFISFLRFLVKDCILLFNFKYVYIHLLHEANKNMSYALTHTHIYVTWKKWIFFQLYKVKYIIFSSMCLSFLQKYSWIWWNNFAIYEINYYNFITNRTKSKWFYTAKNAIPQLYNIHKIYEHLLIK